MKYLCLAYYNEKQFDALSKTEVHALVSQCPAYDEATGSVHLRRVRSTMQERRDP